MAVEETESNVDVAPQISSSGEDSITYARRKRSTSVTSSSPPPSDEDLILGRFVECMNAITSASNAKIEKFIKAQAALEQFSISKCMDVFRTMQDVPSNQRLKALDVLVNNVVYREAFLAMDEDFRHVWMMSLGSSD